MSKLLAARRCVALALAVLLLPEPSSGGAAQEPDPVDSFIRALKTDDQYAVSRAEHGHWFRRDDGAKERLVPALRDPDPRVRSGVASLLGRLGVRQAIQPLVAALKDPEAKVRPSALGNIADGPYNRGDVGDPAVLPGLLALLKDPEAGVRESALHALRLPSPSQGSATAAPPATSSACSGAIGRPVPITPQMRSPSFRIRRPLTA